MTSDSFCLIASHLMQSDQKHTITAILVQKAHNQNALENKGHLSIC